jgi:hypothetical protein
MEREDDRRLLFFKPFQEAYGKVILSTEGNGSSVYLRSDVVGRP